MSDCRKCGGTGVEPPQPEWTEPAERKPPTNVNVNVPKNEQPEGGVALKSLIARAGDALNGPLGYDASTPAYYVLSAVLHDWLESQAGGTA